MGGPTYWGNSTVATGGIIHWAYAAPLLRTETITLPTITENYLAHGFIQVADASTGVISKSAEFEYGSTGEVSLIRGTENIEANAATASKISLGPASPANPVVIKNNYASTDFDVMITLDYK